MPAAEFEGFIEAGAPGGPVDAWNGPTELSA
jgi:hypothetical protein